jgi:ATP-dependent Clp protease ATP-binding subunit ClpC
MFERFTDAARRMAVLAQEEARKLNHAVIGPEHLLLSALWGDGTPGGGHLVILLKEQHGLTYAAVQKKVETLHDESEVAPIGPIPFNEPATESLKKAAAAASTLDYPVIPEQLLLGIIALNDKNINDIFANLHVDRKELRRDVIESGTDSLLQIAILKG